jgi:TspO/MBR family
MKRYLFLIATVITIAFNGAATAKLIGGQDTKYISDVLTPTIITPNGQTFAIWAVIYTGLLAISIANAMDLYPIGPRTLAFYIASCLANCAWIVTWQLQVPYIPAALLFILLFCNIVVAFGLRNIFKHVYLIYTSWIVIASVINATVFFQYNLGIKSIQGVENYVVAVILLSIGALLYLIMSLKYDSLIPVLVGAWAYLGISRVPEAIQPNNDIRSAAMLYMWVLLAIFAGLIYKDRRYVLDRLQ